MIRRAGILFSLFLLAFSVTAQIFEPVSWETTYKQVSDDEFDLIFKATIDEGWSIYSQDLEGEDGPIPTSFTFDEGTHFELDGKTTESDNRIEAHDPFFDMVIAKFKKKAEFTQRVKVKDSSKPITGYYTFMTCNDERCLPPEDVDFSFKLVAKASKTAPKGQESGAVEEKKETKIAAADTEEDGDPIAEMMDDVQEDPQEAPAVPSQSGIFDPVKWGVAIEKVDDQTYDLVFKAKIQEGWNIYSYTLDGEDGPIPTTFYWDEGENYSLAGELTESSSKKVKEYDKNFDMDLIKLKKDATFRQRVMVSSPDAAITGELEFMSCDDSRCLPPQYEPFTFIPSKLSATLGEQPEEEVAAAINAGPYSLPVNLKPNASPVGKCENVISRGADIGGSSIWNIFFLGFVGGLIALLTPCVFPMIPLTVSFFTKGAQDKRKGLINAFMYGFFILAVYVLLSLPFHLMDSLNPDILNDISTNIWLNIAFFAIFLFFAFSFFGYYEITLPSSWTNRASSAEGIGGMLGVFFMALTLALVSFSCTGPILGSLLAGALSSDGGAMQLTSGMAGFGLALALPFGLFAAFPRWLNTLPKSGGWLNSVKVVLGFIELALAFKFLSNADLVTRWGLLKIEPFLIIWILTAIGLALYLFGKLKFPHDSPIKKLSPARIVLGLVTVAFAVYLASGFRYNEKTNTFTSLTLLSGLAPPVGYSWIYPNKCPNNLDCFKDLESGISYAQEVDKPIIIDFTGHACVNCRKMEEHVWPKGSVYKHLKDDYVLISLYVDEKIELPEEEQVVVERKTGGTRKLRTYGNKWAHFQAEYFNNNSQPYYVLLSPDGKLLNQPVGYTPDSEEYTNFLKCGLESFEQLRNQGLLGQK
jgi:thiol:disulfide interchange protein